jgi:hypothetical protein
MKLVGHVASMADERSAYRGSVARPEGRRPLGRYGHRWNDNIKMDVDWIDVQDKDRRRAVVNAVMDLSFSIKCGIFLDHLRKFLAFQEGFCSIWLVI